MKVRAIRAKAFMRHDATDLALPDTGVVLITGANGQGKSTLMEAVAHAGWGKSLRGAPGWRTGVDSGVEIELDDGLVRRSCSRTGSKRLTWRVGERGAGEYPTLTKAQEALEEVIGPFDVWARACVFSSHEASRFTTATDRERKHLLEELLQLDRFTRAYDLARADRRSERSRADTLTAELRAAQAKVTSLHAQATQATEAANEQGGGHVKFSFAAEREHELTARLTELERALSEVSELTDAARALARQREAAEMSLAGDEHRISGLGDACPQCRQHIPAEHVDEVRDELRECMHLASQLADEARAALRAHEQNARALTDQRSAARYELAEVRADLRQHVEARARAEAWEQRAAELTEQATAAEQRAAELDAVCDVLGLQGVRAGLLTAALTQVEHVANGWLTQLGMSQLRVRLSTTTTSATGRVSDRISFDVDGAGGGHGYNASSGGERRRIDIAVMLALADVAARGRGVADDSTLFFDELFDALDAQGVEDAVAVLRVISQHRCVVVISHSAALISRMPDALCVTVEDGAARVEV